MPSRVNLRPILVTLTFIITASACTPKGQTTIPADRIDPTRPQLSDAPPLAVPDDAWQPAPAAISIFPSTRFVIENHQPLLEARLELRDQMGDPIKASGALRFELLAAPDNPASARRVYTWRVGLFTADQHREHYDPIIAGYRFQLRLDDKRLLDRRTLLRVTFDPLDADRLTTQSIIKIDW